MSIACSPDNVRYLRDLIYRRSAIVVDAEKDYLLESRLSPLAKSAGLEHLDALATAVRKDERSPLARALVEAMTTNETSFFRDVHPFEALKTHVVPRLLAARATTRSLRIWCAASSTGQEPYSIAMALRESIPQIGGWNVQILATDINAAVLARAREGRYKQLEVNRGLPAQMLVKYFDRVGAEWKVKPEVASMVSFQELNLLERWPLFTEQDVVFIRNVLIYFDVPTKRALLGRVRKWLRPDGFLFLGGAETTLNVDAELAPVRVGSTVLYQPKTPVEGVAHAAAR